MSETSRRELGEFLRTRRERITPERVGIPVGGRRRTPGLRREEVAALAGVGVTWYTWLEQGRSINASTQVLEAIAAALRMNDAEQRHLWELAGVGRPTVASAIVTDVTSAYQPVLDKLHPYPACIQNSRFDILAYNRGYRFLFRDLESFSPTERNCVRLFFLDPSWRKHYVDDEIVAVRMAAKLRAEMGARLEDPRFATLVAELSAGSAEFAELWSRHDVVVHHYDVKRIRHPQVGLLKLTFVQPVVDDSRGLKMSVMTPCDEASARRLDELAELTAAVPDEEHADVMAADVMAGVAGLGRAG